MEGRPGSLENRLGTRYSEVACWIGPEPVLAIAWGSPGKEALSSNNCRPWAAPASTAGCSTASWLGEAGKPLTLSGPQFFIREVGTVMALTEKTKLREQGPGFRKCMVKLSSDGLSALLCVKLCDCILRHQIFPVAVD